MADQQKPWWHDMPDPILNKMTDLMRAVDAYAFDYARDGKMAKTRRDVEREIAQALTAGVSVVDGQTFSHTDADEAQQEGKKK